MPSSLNDVIESSARGGFVLVFGSILANLILALGLIVVPRLLGPDQYGLYALAFILPSLLMLIADFGANAGLTRFSASLVAKGQDKKAAEILKYGLLFKTVISVVAFAVSFVFADYFGTHFLNRPDAGVFVRLASLALPFQLEFDAINSAFVGLNQMLSVAIITILQATIKVAASIGLVLLGFGVIGALAGQIVGYSVVGILAPLVFFARPYRKLRESNEDSTTPAHGTKAVKTLITYGFPLYVSALLGGFVPQFQGIILAQFTSNTEIGNFRAAANLLTLLAMVTTPITTTLFPAFSRLDPKEGDIKRFFHLSVKYTTLLIIPATLIVLLFNREIAYIAYGSNFASAPLYLVIYCTTYLLAGLGSLVLGTFFNGTGNTLMTLRMSLVSLILILTLTPLSTAFYGVIGLITAQLVAGLCATIYGLNLVRTRFQIKLHARNLLKIYIASALAALPVATLLNVTSLWWGWRIMIGVTMYLITWLTLTPLTGTINETELHSIQNLLEKRHTLRRILLPIVRYEERLARARTRTKIKPSSSQTTK